MRFLMSGSLKIHYYVTAVSEQLLPPHWVIIEDDRQDGYVIPFVLRQTVYGRAGDFPEMAFWCQRCQDDEKSPLINT